MAQKPKHSKKTSPRELSYLSKADVSAETNALKSPPPIFLGRPGLSDPTIVRSKQFSHFPTRRENAKNNAEAEAISIMPSDSRLLWGAPMPKRIASKDSRSQKVKNVDSNSVVKNDFSENSSYLESLREYVETSEKVKKFFQKPNEL